MPTMRHKGKWIPVHLSVINAFVVTQRCDNKLFFLWRETDIFSMKALLPSQKFIYGAFYVDTFHSILLTLIWILNLLIVKKKKRRRTKRKMKEKMKKLKMRSRKSLPQREKNQRQFLSKRNSFNSTWESNKNWLTQRKMKLTKLLLRRKSHK